MADRAVVAVFDTQNQAYDAAADLQRLSDDGTIEVRRGAIVTKDDKGNLTVADSRNIGAPWGLLGGGLIGGLLGLLLGPAGAAVGMSYGAAAGGTADLVGLGLQEDFISDVGSRMDPGKSALLVEVAEGSTGPVDAAVARHHGKVYRSDLSMA